jgi:hypothetical protein
MVGNVGVWAFKQYIHSCLCVHCLSGISLSGISLFCGYRSKFRPYSLYCFSKYKIFKQKFKCFKYCFLKTEHFVLWDKMAKTNLIS